MIGSTEAETAAEKLQGHLDKIYGISPAIVLNGSASQQIRVRVDSSMTEDAYDVTVENGELIIAAGHPHTLEAAVEAFTAKNTCPGKIFALSGSLINFTGTKASLSGTYTYVWGDEFMGPTLDESRWDRNGRMSAFSDLDVDKTDKFAAVKDDNLKLTAGLSGQTNKAFVAPGSVSTRDTMSFKHGYLEIRAKVPFGKGRWPSFWSSSYGALNANQTADYTIEVDLFEMFAQPDKIACNVHKWYADGRHTQWNEEGDETYVFSDAENLSNEYHVYGMEWTAENITFYVDGRFSCAYDLTRNFDKGASGMGGFDTTLALIINNHLFTANSSYKPYSGCEATADDVPSVYEIDYVRLYQKAGDELYVR